MKAMFIFLMLPLLSAGQTVHIKKERIVYEGEEKAGGLSASEVFDRMQKILPTVANKYRIVEQYADAIQATGELKLKTPYHLIRTVSYLIMIKPVENGYQYRIDNVSFTEQERGEKPVVKSSKEVVDNMGETGKIVRETEKLLNETDMKFQRLLDIIRNKIRGDD